MMTVQGDRVALPSYPAYKPVGLAGLAEIPVHWETKRAKFLFREANEPSEVGEEELLSVSHITGVTPRSEKNITMFKAESYEGFKTCQPGDLVINTMWAWMGALGVSPLAGIVSSSYGVYRLRNGAQFNPRYLDLLLRTKVYVAEYTRRSTGINSSRLRLYPEDFFDVVIIRPPIEEQDAIAALLDRKLAEIGRFIHNKGRRIELLQEQKTAIINRTVTRGLNPKVKMKPSGFESLGEIPKHWEVKPLRYLASKFGSGVTPTGGAQVYQASGIPLIRSQNVHFDGLRLDDVAYISSEIHESMRNSALQAGDVLLNITGASIGRSCHVPEWMDAANVNQHVCIIRPRQWSIRPQYLSYFLGSNFIQAWIWISQYGAAREGLNLTNLKAFPILVPPVEEQDEILCAIEKETESTQSAIASTQREIELMQEYRTALIAEAVTGRLTVEVT